MQAIRINMYKDYLASVQVRTALDFAALGTQDAAIDVALYQTPEGTNPNSPLEWVVHPRVAFDDSRWDLNYVAEFWPQRRTAQYVRIRLPYDGLKLSFRAISLYGIPQQSESGVCPNNCSDIPSACNAATGVCDCPNDADGADCSLAPCTRVGNDYDCGNGTCDVTRGVCTCAWGFHGPGCNLTTTCPSGRPNAGAGAGADADDDDFQECFGRGTCVAGRCSCDAGFSGADCRYAQVPFRTTTEDANGNFVTQTEVVEYLDFGSFPRVPGGPRISNAAAADQSDLVSD